MNIDLLKNTIDLVAQFEKENENHSFSSDIDGFKSWIVNQSTSQADFSIIEWEGKGNGRSAESVISTLLVHLNRYAKNYSKSAIFNSDFSTQDEFIFLINLKTFGEMSKMELIKKNIQDKPTGMQIISRLIKQGWVEQKSAEIDKRSKIISITTLGEIILENQMNNIREATKIVSGNLTENEKLQLIYLLNKLEEFHLPIYLNNFDSSVLLKNAIANKRNTSN
jgi:MarR family transcriptional regulator, lower aerobic nicotinate degradation pathway regulator